MQSRKRSLGFTLLETMLVAAIGIAVASIAVTVKVRHSEASLARSLGTELGQYNNAVRKYIAEVPTLLLSTPMTFPAVFEGSAWLKDSACGGSASRAYLPCSFADSPTAFKGMGRYTTAIVMDPVTGEVTAITRIDNLTLNGEKRGDLAGLAAQAAIGVSPVTGAPVWSSTYADFSANDDPESGPASTLDDPGALYARAATSPASDAWLRVDGVNRMHANLDMNGHDIVDANDVYGKKILDKGDSSFYLEPAGGAMINQAEVLGADKAPGGSGINEGRLETDLGIAHGRVSAPVYEDLNNGGFFVDPHQTSLLRTLEVTGADGLVNPSAPSTFGVNRGLLSADSLQASQQVESPIFVDADDPGVLFNPSASPRYWLQLEHRSVLNSIYVVGGDALLTKVSAASSVNPASSGLTQTDWLLASHGMAVTRLYDLDDPQGMSGSTTSGAGFKYRLDLNQTTVAHALTLDAQSQGGQLFAPHLIDTDDQRFILDPSDISRVRDVSVRDNIWADSVASTNRVLTPVLYDYDDPARYRLDMSANTRFKVLRFDNTAQGGFLKAPILYDADNLGYYVDPQNYSRFNRLTVTGTSVFESQADFRGTTHFRGNANFTTPVAFQNGAPATFNDLTGFQSDASFGQNVSVANNVTADTGRFKKLFVNGIEVGARINSNEATLNAYQNQINSQNSRLAAMLARANSIQLIRGPQGPAGAQGPPGPRGPSGKHRVIYRRR